MSGPLVLYARALQLLLTVSPDACFLDNKLFSWGGASDDLEDRITALLNKAILLEPMDVEARCVRGMWFAVLGEDGHAIADLLCVQQIARENLDILGKIAPSLVQAGDMEGAVEIIDRVEAQRELDTRLLRARGQALRWLKDTRAKRLIGASC